MPDKAKAPAEDTGPVYVVDCHKKIMDVDGKLRVRGEVVNPDPQHTASLLAGGFIALKEDVDVRGDDD